MFFINTIHQRFTKLYSIFQENYFNFKKIVYNKKIKINKI